jgi:hypothetical protein
MPDIVKSTKEMMDLVNNFNFHRVYKAMEHLEWDWVGVGIPSQIQLMNKALELLEIAYDNWVSDGDFCEVNSGGFRASCKGESTPVLTLEFVLSSISSDEI